MVDCCGYDEVYARKSIILNEKLVFVESRFPFLRQQNFKPLDAGQSNGLLSVVVPYFNMGEYIEETITSIIQSDYRNFEIIIVNDGSTDIDSINKLKLYEGSSQIRIFHKANEGLSSARNFGAAHAMGEFLAFLDADDLVCADYFNRAISLLHTYNNVFFVGCWVKYFGESDSTWPCFTPEPPFVLVHNMANTSALVYKTEAFLRGGLNDPEMIFGMEDYDSLLSLIGKGYNGVIIPEVLFHYRVRKDSMARQFNNDKVLYLYQRISAKHIGLFSMYGGVVAGILNANGPGFSYDNPTLDANRVSGIVRKILPGKVFRYLKRNKTLRKNIHLIKRLINN